MTDEYDLKPRAPSPAAGFSPPSPIDRTSDQASAQGPGDGSSSSAANTVALPKIVSPEGGGAIQSIGEKFAANAATGTAGLTVPIATSAGRAGASLGLDISYDSGAGNGPFGVGWRLSTGSITRKTDKGIPRYVDENETDVFILAGAEDLVPVRDGDEVAERIHGGFRVRRYRPRVEGAFARIERWIDRTSGDAHWRVTTGGNVTSVFGRSPQARIVDPTDHRNVFSWLLEETRDDRGNIIVYEYKQEDGEGIDPARVCEASRFDGSNGGEYRFRSTAQRYIKRIRYGNDRPDTSAGWHFEVVFDYGEHADLTPAETRPWAVRRDPFSTYRPGFELRTYRLCRRVLMFHRFEELGPGPVLVRSTDLGYEERDHLTLLKRVVHVGYLDGDRAEFPPIDLSYTLRTLNEEARTLDEQALEGIHGGVDGGAARWVDLNGEGLPGALISEERGWYYKSNLGGGELAPPELLRALPSPGDVRSGAQALVDLASEGRLDLARFEGSLPGYFGRTLDDGWTAFTPFTTLPRIDWQDPNLRFLDVDGDGLTDILITHDDAIVWYRSHGKQGFGAPEVIAKPRDERNGAAVVFADRTEAIFVADMSGDGLGDIVRIRSGEVCYWPNLGYGRFGRKVILDDSPRFTEIDQFDPRHVRLADVDGSGTSDVLYLGRHGVHVYFNESGNRLTDAGLVALPIPHSAGTIDAVDLLGRGTTCLVWSSPLPADSSRPIAYVDLMGGVKPHLLSRITNGIGAETRVSYAASTEFYLRDKREGRPWATKLAFPVQVVERVERYDHIAESKLVTRYRYHHGFYDGIEREYRGFAFVESWDAESFEGGAGKGLFPEAIERIADDLRVPPVLTKTWFHTGAWLEQEPLERVLAREYYRGDPDAPILPPTRVPSELRGADAREAARSLHGMLLRQEIYSEDGTADSGHPYTVSERACEVRMLQPVLGARHGVFFPHPREQLDAVYERKPLDPRISHKLTLSVDEYGNVTESAAAAYPRRHPEEPEQARLWVTFASARFVNHAPEDGWYRLGVMIEGATSELTGLPHGALLRLDSLRRAVRDAVEIPFEAEPGHGRLERRVLARQRQTFYREDLSGPLPLGAVESRALPYETYRAAFTPGLLQLAFGDRVSGTLLETEGGYSFSDHVWWARSGRLVYDPVAFYQATEAIDPFGNRSFLRFDPARLMVVETRDAVGNTVEAHCDYRALAPNLVVDANHNRTAAAYDARGMAVRIALMGKEGAGEGDTLEDPTIRIECDPLRYVSSGGAQPAFVHSSAREVHGPENRHWQRTYTYSDGSGRTAMVKVQAAPGETPLLAPDGTLRFAHVEHRWIGSGRTIFDNKGNAVKQYEPFFSTTPEFETERSLVEWGVTPVIRYDPLGRAIRTDLPNGSFVKVLFAAWAGENWDPNDTVLESRWYRDRGSPDPAGPEPKDDPPRRAAWLAAQHANTPARARLDSLGRTFLVEQDNRDPAGLYRTRTVLDVTGNTRAITDARGVRTLDQQIFDLLSRTVATHSADAGARCGVDDTGGSPLRAWDARGYMLSPNYDRLRRPTHSFISYLDGRKHLTLRMVYGEGVSDAARHNLRAQLHQMYDGAGVVTQHAFDFKGNLLRSERRLARRHSEVLDWSSVASLEEPETLAPHAAPLLESNGYVTRAIYDALNRVVSSVTPDLSDVRPHYDPGSLVDRIEVAVRGRHDGQRPYVRDIEYNARGQRIRVVRGDGVATTYVYEPETFRLSRLQTRRRDGRYLQDLAYEYDPIGNIVSVRDGVSFGNASVSASGLYQYDALYRLTFAEGREHPGQQPSSVDAPILTLPHTNDLGALRRYREEYAYDPVGNILRTAHRTLGEGVRSGWTRIYEYAIDSNRLRSTSTPADHQHGGAEHYSYDPNGNLTTMTHLREMRWDYENRLASVDRGGGGRVEFAYDASGQRIRKTYVHSGLVEERIYLGSYEIYRKRDAQSGDVLLERETLHVFDVGGRLALLETKTIDASEPTKPVETQVRYQLSNQIESSVLEVDVEGLVITYEEYLPFGASAVRAASAAAEVSVKRYRYTGQERDDETGLYYQGARYYAPWLGRWTSADPAGFTEGTNLFCYSRNNPIARTDPSGTESDTPSAAAPPSDSGANDLVDLGTYEDHGVRYHRYSTFAGDFVYEFQESPAANAETPSKPASAASHAAKAPAQPASRAPTEQKGLTVKQKQELRWQAGKAGIWNEFVEMAASLANLSVSASLGSASVLAPHISLDWLKMSRPTSSDALQESLLQDNYEAGGYVTQTVSAATSFVPVGEIVASAKLAAGTGRVATVATSGAGAGVAAAARGEVAIDANAVTGMFERGEQAAVETAMAGRRPVVSITAAKEYMRGAPTARTLADRLARAQQLRVWLTQQGGRIGAGASEADVIASQMAAGRFGKTLKLGDARVLASAEREGLSILTRDIKFRNILKAFGLPWEPY